MSYKKKEHGGERQPSTMQMKRLPCRVLTDHTECWWTRLTIPHAHGDCFSVLFVRYHILQSTKW